jgi:hypothetical protein
MLLVTELIHVNVSLSVHQPTTSHSILKITRISLNATHAALDVPRVQTIDAQPVKRISCLILNTSTAAQHVAERDASHANTDTII